MAMLKCACLLMICLSESAEDKPKLLPWRGSAEDPSSPRGFQVGEVWVVDDGFVTEEEKHRLPRLYANEEPLHDPRQKHRITLNHTMKHFTPNPEDRPFLEDILKRIKDYAEKYVHPVPDAADKFPFDGKYYLDSYVIRRYVTDIPKHSSIQPHLDVEMPGRCLSATLHMQSEAGVKGGAFQTFHCPPEVNCRAMQGGGAYKPFMKGKEARGMNLSSEVPYKHGRLTYFLAATPHATQVLRQGQRDILFVWIGCIPTLRPAMESGHVELARELLQARAGIDSSYAKGLTALHHTIFHGHDGMRDLFISEGADIMAKGRRGITPLHSAAEGGHIGSIERLIELRADLCAVGFPHGTRRPTQPLHLADKMMKHDAVKRLLELGADKCPGANWNPKAKSAGKNEL